MNYTLEIGSKTHKFTDDAITFKNTQSTFNGVSSGNGSAFSFRLDEKDYTPEREKMLQDVYKFLIDNQGSMKDPTVTIKYYSPSMKKYVVIGTPKNIVVENETRLDTSKEGSNSVVFMLSILG